ncbi:flavin-containing monooxygenase FMO GS-OX-like 2 isoform X2 [Sceloporus undulatus]|uniref:flavin-containing monooxygenase FMO GS-OX-like 2 isoform X2 n=1 Tax=Sceloporus undulatus TaxID=8520 RepID=UPI001C4D59E1|nr:flavin-containing monooxygenase FMO GS-OX-like 2 isoform X2 [Sceloporus undulatus]
MATPEAARTRRHGPLLRVAVVGAGAAGLCALRHLLASAPGTFAPPTLFEAGAGVGGTWLYQEEEEEEGERERKAPRSSMYRDLRTNLPKEVMAFPDAPFEPQLPSFLHHSAVLGYLRGYAETFGLLGHIRFQWRVDDIQPTAAVAGEGSGPGGGWEVTASWQGPGSEQKTLTEQFDAIMVCTGHYSVPFVPPIAGLDSFQGRLLHSHSFRRPEPFAGLSVVLVGGGASGVDLALLLSAVAARVVLSHRGPLVRGLPSSVAQVPSVSRVDGGTVAFEDGSDVWADVLILCTGYRPHFPFLPLDRLGLQDTDHGPSPLYRHLLPPRHPSLFLIGLCQQICPFPHFHCQVLFALAVLTGRCPLPSAAEMEANAWAELDRHLKAGGQPRHFLRLNDRQWSYAEDLARQAGFPPLPPITREIWEAARENRARDVGAYRNGNYHLLGPDAWELVWDASGQDRADK